MRQMTYPLTTRYFVAGLSVLSAVLLTLLNATFDQWVTYSFFFGAVMVSTWYGGRGPGLLTTTLSALAIHYFFLPSIHSTRFGLDEIVRLGPFIVVALLISELKARQRQARNILRQSAAELEAGVAQHKADLLKANAQMEEEIAKCKQALEALRESEGRFRHLANHSPVMIWMSNSGKLCSYFNRVWLDFTGRALEEELGDGWSVGVHAGDLSRCLNTYLAAFDARREFTEKYRLRRFDGKYRWVLETGVPRFTPDGTFMGYIGSCIDITDSVESEEALRKAESRFRSVFENAVEGMFQTTPEGRIININPALASMYGYVSPEDMMTSVTDIGEQLYAEPERRAEYTRLLEAQGSVQGFEVEHYRKDGSKFWVSANAHAVRDANGTLLFYGGTVLDITERRKAEEISSLLAAMVESADEAIVGEGLDGRIFSWNKGAEKLYGYSAQEAIGQPMSIIIPPDRGAEMDQIKETIQQGKSLEHFETLRVRKNGEQVHVLMGASPIYDASGKIRGISKLSRDITSQKRAEEALRESHVRTRALLAAMPDLMFRISKEGILLEFVSSEDGGLLATSDQYLGKYLDDVLPSDVARLTMRHARQALKTRELQTYEYVVPLQGKVHAFEARLVVSGKDEVLAIVRDVTDLKRVEKQLRHLAENLTSTQEAERRRISRELHDETGQSLTAIAVRLHLVERQLTREKPVATKIRAELRQLRKVAESSQERLRSLAHALHPSVLEHLGLNAALRSFIQGLQARSNIKVSVFINDDFPRLSPTAESTIYRIVQEAATNAVRHSRARTLSLRCTAGDGLALVAVGDDGCGFDSTSAEGSGTVGLTSMRERAEMIGAKLSIASLRDQGTLVTLCVPLDAREQTDEALFLLLQK